MRQEDQRVDSDHPEAVRSAPVPVPPATSGGSTAEPDDRTDTDEATGGQGRARPWDGRPGGDEGGFHEPGPVPTAFGATTVGGAVAASALASPRPEDEPDPREERTARPGDGAVDGGREGRRADPTAEFPRAHDRDDDGTDRERTSGGPDGDDRVQDTDDDRTPGTAVPAGGATLPTDAADGRPGRRADLSDQADVTDQADRADVQDRADRAGSGATGYGSADPALVDPDAVPTQAEAALGAAARPTATAVPSEPATLFDDDAAQGFRDRWRDVQLRFVDDPKAAVGDAQSLVDEAIQALAAALRAQKEKLGGWQDAGSADTEQLRVAVRQYRDFLDRVLGR